jgi:hemerythrin-like domain-containing protein
MTNTDAWYKRTPLAGYVDFTMMYVAHDAFARDLRRMTDSCQRGQALTPGTLAGWAMFTKQLHIHHTAEDISLWPKLRAAVAEPEEVAILDAMEAEHAQLDPQLERIDGLLAAQDEEGLVDGVRTLAEGLAAHMQHEETEALPLIESYLGSEGWAAFGRDIRKTQGISGGAEYLPWVLDEAPDRTKTKVLRLLPPPVRLLYRRIWEPQYRRNAAWDQGVRA